MPAFHRSLFLSSLQLLEEVDTLKAFFACSKLPSSGRCICEEGGNDVQHAAPARVGRRRCRGLCGGLPFPSRGLLLPNGNPLTPEQVEIIQTAVKFTVEDAADEAGPGSSSGGSRGGPVLAYSRPLQSVFHRILAFAGCGKTSTLLLLAKAHPGLNILYLAYNK